MTILAVSNLSADFGGDVVDTTSTLERDTAYSPTGLEMNTAAASSFEWPAASGDDTWIHFRTRTDANHVNGGSDGYWLTLKMADGTDVARIDVNDGFIFAVVYGDSTVNGGSITIGSSTNVTMDLRVSTAGGNLTFEIYTNGSGSPISSATAANTGGKTAPVQLLFDNIDISGSSAPLWYYSEFIVTDSEDTRGWRLATLEPNTNGNYNQWNGGVNELGDSDLATSASSDTGAERQSWNPTAYGGAVSPSSVRAVIGRAQAARGVAGSPSQVTQFLRISSTDYDGSAEVFATGESMPIMEVWDDNPNTASAWATADLASLEMGLLSTT